MKKIALFILIASTFSACSPQATVTPEATVALTATPTVTFTPTPSQTPTPEPTPTPDPAQIAAEEMGKLNLVLDTDYTLAPDENGNLAAFNKAGVKIYEPSTNLWNSNLIAKIVENSLKITGDCEKTDLSPSGDFLKINRHGLKMQSELTELGASPRIDHLHFQFLFLRSPSNRAQNQFCWMFTLSYPEDPPERPFIAFWRTEAGGETQIHWADLFNPEE